MIITVCPLVTEAPFERHCLRSVPATGAFTASPPVTAAGALALAAGAAAEAAERVGDLAAGAAEEGAYQAKDLAAGAAFERVRQDLAIRQRSAPDYRVLADCQMLVLSHISIITKHYPHNTAGSDREQLRDPHP